MDEELKEQIKRVKLARARLAAEIQVMRAMIPDEVDSTIHFDGKQRARERHPSYAEVINLI